MWNIEIHGFKNTEAEEIKKEVLYKTNLPPFAEGTFVTIIPDNCIDRHRESHRFLRIITNATAESPDTPDTQVLIQLLIPVGLDIEIIAIPYEHFIPVPKAKYY